MKIKSLAIALSIICGFGLVNGTNRLYVENHSGGQIVCRINDDSRRDVVIARNMRVFVGTIKWNKQAPLVAVTSLAVRNNSMFSGYMSLDNELQTIGMTYLNCSGNDCSKDAVLIIKPSGYTGRWVTSINWESTVEKPVIYFEMDDFK
jgi:hypothetical protein